MGWVCLAVGGIMVSIPTTDGFIYNVGIGVFSNLLVAFENTKQEEGAN